MSPILLKFPWCGKQIHRGNNLCLWHVHKNRHVLIRSWHMVKKLYIPTTSMSFVPFFWCHVSLEYVQTSSFKILYARAFANLLNVLILSGIRWLLITKIERFFNSLQKNSRETFHLVYKTKNLVSKEINVQKLRKCFRVWIYIHNIWCQKNWYLIIHIL